MLFIIAGWALLIGGAFAAWRFGWRDPGKGTRRCPKCWYEMTAGMKCPECGREAKSEKQLHRARRRWGWIGVGLALMVVSYPVFKWPLYLQFSRRGNGALAFCPRTGMILAWPTIRWWETASFAEPKAWWAKKNPQSVIDCDSLMRSQDLWKWQEWLKQRVAAEVLARSESSLALDSAAMHIAYSRDQYPWAVDAVMEAYVRDQPPYRVVHVRPNLRTIDPKWIEPVAASIVKNGSRLADDSGVVAWLALSDRNMDDIADVIGRSRLIGDNLSSAVNALAGGKISRGKVLWLLPRIVNRRDVSGAALAKLTACLGREGDEFWPMYARALTHRYVTDRIEGCVILARSGTADPQLLALLALEQNGAHQAGCLAAEMAKAVLEKDEERLRELVNGACAFLHQFHERDKRAFTSMVLVRFAESGVLPEELVFDCLDAASDGDALDNWWYSVESLTRLSKLRGADDPRVVQLIAHRLAAGQLSGVVAWNEFAARGHAPKALIDAAREYAKIASGANLTQIAEQLREIRQEP